MKIQKSKTRFSRHCGVVMWLIIQFLPIIVYIFNTWMLTESVDFAAFIAPWRFGFIADIINDVLQTVQWSVPAVTVDLVSYMVLISIIHVIYDVLVFIPHFAHNLIGGMVDD